MWRCPRCGEEIEEVFDACWKCGSGRDGPSAENFLSQLADASACDADAEDEGGAFDLAELGIPPTCSPCDVAMTLGHIPDFAHGTILQESWIEGPPEKAGWFGRLNTREKNRYAITAYRCPKCGRLELYATHRFE